MIPRNTAASIVGLLDDALMHLLKAGVLLDEAASEDPLREHLELLWLPTSSAADMLDGIDAAFPDLARPDRVFRTPSEKPIPRRLDSVEIGRMRAHLAHALAAFEQVIAILRAPGEYDVAGRERWLTRYEESNAALQSMIAQLDAC